MAPNRFLFISILSMFISFAIPKPPNGFSLQLIHRDSPESPFNVKKLANVSQGMTRLVRSSNSRANFRSGIDNNRLRLELLHDQQAMYLVKLNFGSPSIPLFLYLDTGSSLFWTQCEPCTYRFRQTSPIYNSTASHTFLKLPCEHPFCRFPTFTCQHGECVYRITYSGNHTTAGVAASEVFQPSNNVRMQICFGCSRDNRHFEFFGQNGKVGGIMGLGMSPISFLHQLVNVTQYRFSYCLTAMYSGGNGTSLLRFGDDVITRGRRFKSTPIIYPPNEYIYFLNLQDISVEGRRLNIPPNTFAVKRDGSGGCIIDTGTPVTRIIHPAYQIVMTAFRVYFDSYGLRRVYLPRSGLELCYKVSERLPKYASMTYHFEGADFEVEPRYMYQMRRDHDAFCVELVSSERGTTLGSLQQINTRFVYNVAARQLLFTPEECQHDR